MFKEIFLILCSKQIPIMHNKGTYYFIFKVPKLLTLAYYQYLTVIHVSPIYQYFKFKLNFMNSISM